MSADKDPAVEQFLELLDLRDQGQGVFTGAPSPNGRERSRMYGGQLLAQALAAASFTVPPEWVCHSAHGYFVRPAQAARPTDYEVSEMRDGKSGGLRKVVAVQRDELTCELTAAFADDEPSAEYQRRMPDVPAPESFADDAAAKQSFGPADLILVDRRKPVSQPEFAPLRTWARFRTRLNDDPNLHRCALTYISDMAAVEPGMRGAAVKPGDPNMQVASLEHAVWFHRPFRCDEWLLFDCECVSLAAGRGLNRGYVYSRTGELIASLMQETMLRQRDAIAAV